MVLDRLACLSSIERASKIRVGSKNELWEVKNQIGPENINEEEGHECLESESRKSK